MMFRKSSDRNFSASLKAFLPWFVGTLILMAVLVAVEILVGWENTLSLWGHVSLFTLIMAFSLFAVSHVIRAIRIYAYVTKKIGGPFRTTLKLSLMHQFANNILPMRLGETAYPYLMNRYFGTHWVASIAGLFWLRLLDGVIVIGLLLLLYIWEFQVLLWFAVMGGFASLVFYLWINRFHPDIMPKWLVKVMDALREAAPGSWREVAVLTALTFACWVSKLCALALFVTSLQTMSLIAALSGVLGAELSSILPIHGIAGAGTYEAAFMAAAVPHGIKDQSVIANAVNMHIFVLASTSVLALLIVPLKVRLYKQNSSV